MRQLAQSSRIDIGFIRHPQEEVCPVVQASDVFAERHTEDLTL